MKVCKNCKHFKTDEFAGRWCHYGKKLSYIDLVTGNEIYKGVERANRARSYGWFLSILGNKCGVAGRHFEPIE